MKLATLTLLASALMFAQAGKTTLKVGDTAPGFEKLPSSVPGKAFSLADFKGQKTVVLAFFPLAFTGGCTTEMKGFQEGLEKYTAAGAQIFGISVDAAPSLKRFSDDLGLAFPLLSDFPNRNTAKAYGVFMEERGIASRTTFVIDGNGKIAEIIFDPKAAPHNEASLAACARIKGKS